MTNKYTSISIAFLLVVLLGFFCATLIENKPEVEYYTSENYDIIDIMMTHSIKEIRSIPRSDAKVKTDGDFYIEYHKDIFGVEWLVEVDLLDDEVTADAADLKSQLEKYKK